MVIDLGTGDGRFVSASAAKNPEKFFIGIDANVEPLEKPSMRAMRKPSKRGLPNALFVQAAVEDLPSELDGLANEVYIQFPWGSLLRGVANGQEWFVKALARVCAPRATVTMILGIDETRDRSELVRLGIPPLSDDHLCSTLVSRYEAGGFRLAELRTELDLKLEIKTSWQRRLSGSHSRKMIYIVLEAR